MEMSMQMQQEPKTRHRSTPWKYEHGFICGGIDYLADLNYSGLSSDEQDANGSFIVRAVNNHDALVEALTAVLQVARKSTWAHITTGPCECKECVIANATKALSAAKE